MKTFYSLLLLVVSLTFLQAQEKPEMPTGFRGEFLVQLKEVEEKVIGLAEAMPQEKYIWRPMEGVRSVSEVFMHLGGANYLFPTFIGIKSPEGLSRDMEKTVTDKAKVIELLKQSFAHVKDAIVKTPDSDLDKPTVMFGNETTVRGVFFTAALHMHEHMGQAIAYARMNNIVPPWTAAEQAVEKKSK
ncbi:MAG: DinB family protein [Ignavibacteriae bacterium]|nr:DinB family protein [Ignavibacteriota bacterium]